MEYNQTELTIFDMLAKCNGKQVTLHTVSGKDISGILNCDQLDSPDFVHLIHIKELAGQDFFSTAIQASMIVGVTYRSKD